MAQLAKQFGLQITPLKLGSVPFVASQRQELNVNNGIPKDYYLFGFIARLTYRFAISAGSTNGTAVVGFPYNLIERFEVSGNHKQYGDATRYLLQGDHTFNLGNVYGKYNHENVNGGLAPGGAGAVGNYDASVTYFIPMVPQNIDPLEQLQYLLDAPRWNTLQLYVDWGAAASLVFGGDRTLAVSAFGSGSGTPSLNITRLIVKLQNARYSHSPIPLKTTYKSLGVGTAAETTTADAFVSSINTGNFLRSLTIVTGLSDIAGAKATKGDNFRTLSDAIYTRVVLKKDDIQVRNVAWTELQQFNGRFRQLPFAWPSGYNEFDFCPHQTVRTSFDTRDIALNNLRFELQGDTTGVANQRIHVIFHELNGIPIFN